MEERKVVLLAEGFFFTKEQAIILTNALEIYNLDYCSPAEWKLIEAEYLKLIAFRDSPIPEGYDTLSDIHD